MTALIRSALTCVVLLVVSVFTAGCKKPEVPVASTKKPTESTIDNYELASFLDGYIDNHDSSVLPVLCYISLTEHLVEGNRRGSYKYPPDKLKEVFVPLAGEFAAYVSDKGEAKAYAPYLYVVEQITRTYGALSKTLAGTPRQEWCIHDLDIVDMDDFGLGLVLLNYGIRNNHPLAIVTAVHILAKFSDADEADKTLFAKWQAKLEELDINPFKIEESDKEDSDKDDSDKDDSETDDSETDDSETDDSETDDSETEESETEESETEESDTGVKLAWNSILFGKLLYARNVHLEQVKKDGAVEEINQDGIFVPISIEKVQRHWEALSKLALDPDARPGDDWRGFLGRSGDGKSKETKVLDRYKNGNSPRVLWQQKVGPGFGACAVSNGQVYLFDRVGNRQRISSRLSSNGNLIWEKTYPIKRETTGEYLGPRCSPVLREVKSSGGGIFIERDVFLYDESGVLSGISQKISDDGWEVKDLWTPAINTLQKYSVKANHHGVTATPVIAGNRLFAVVGGGDSQRRAGSNSDQRSGSAIVAFDLTDGKPVQHFGDYHADHATAKFVEIVGKTYGFAFMREGLMVFEAKDRLASNEIVYIPWRSEERRASNNATPVVINEGQPKDQSGAIIKTTGISKQEVVKVFISTSYGKNAQFRFTFSVLQKPAGDDKYWPRVITHDENPVWQAEPQDSATQPTGGPDKQPMGIAAEFATPIYHNRYLYGCSGRTAKDAELRCVDWETGKVKWSKKGLARTSLLYLDGHFICLNEYGRLFLFKASPIEPEFMEWKLPRDPPSSPGFLPRPLLNYPCWSAPVFSRGLLYIRGKDNLTCLDLLHPAELRLKPSWSALIFLDRPVVQELFNDFMKIDLK